MAHSTFLSTLLLLLLLCIVLVTPSVSLKPPPPPAKPTALLLPITKDSSTLQYVTHLKQRTPPVPLSLVVDLGSPFTWVDCSRGYTSSTYRPVPCKAALCTAPGTSSACTTACYSPPRPGCNNNTCSVNPGNTVAKYYTPGDLSEDAVSLQATDGFNPKSPVTVPRVAFSCAGGGELLKGLARGVVGMAGFGRTSVALPVQFASALGFPNKFAVCLPSSASGTGVMIFGDSPYKFLLNAEVSNSLTYTPLIINPVSTAGVYSAGEKSVEYFIEVKSIQVNGKIVPVRPSLLSINKQGRGGTKISTVNPYTVLESSIYKAVVAAFAKESGLAKVAPTKPFGACFDARGVGSTRVGPGVPGVDLVLGGGANAVWRVLGANLMVGVKPGVLCLGFVDGGRSPATSIVIGGYQLQDNLLQFDLVQSRVGLSGTLLGRQSTCSNFNFTTA